MHTPEVRNYYDSPEYGQHVLAGGGLVSVMAQDQLSPMVSNEDRDALDSSRWNTAIGERIKDMLGHLPLHGADVVIDIGSGLGGPGRNLEEISDAHVVAVNLSEKQLGTHGILSRLLASKYTSLVNTDAVELPFRAESIDHAFSVNALYHIPAIRAVFNELERVLKPEGGVALEDWFTSPQITSENLAKIRNNWSTPDDGFHEFEGFVDKLQAAGFRVTDIIDYTEQAGAFLSEDRFGETYDAQLREKIVATFPTLYSYEGYVPEHATLAAEQLRQDALFMGDLYRSGQASYQQVIAQKNS